MINITIERRHAFLIAAFVVMAALVIPAGVWASDQFSDVPDSNPFHEDINWLKGAGVTLGCGGGEYCPEDFVTREQMAAFMHRLADNQVVDAKSVNGRTAWGWSALASPTTGIFIPFTPAFAYNSEGASGGYEKTSTGRYRVAFDGWTGYNHVQLTTYGDTDVKCQISLWSGFNIFVRCFDADGSSADGQFTIMAFAD